MQFDNEEVLEEMTNRASELDHLVEPVFEDLAKCEAELKEEGCADEDIQDTAMQLQQLEYQKQGAWGRHWVLTTMISMKEVEEDL
jgi:hypothetical protein